LIRPDWTFEINNLFGPTRFGLAAPDGWYLKSVTIDGVNAADEPFTFDSITSNRSNVEVVVSNGAASVSGRVVNDRKEVLSDYSVIVFPTDSHRWYDRSRYMKLARSSQDGGFTVAGLPPGDYLVAAVDSIAGDVGFGDWQNPDVLVRLTPSARRSR
jgi:hypothetical protein